MKFAPGDCVHAAGLGSGVVAGVRNGGRVGVRIKGRIVVVAESQLEPRDPPRRDRTQVAPASRGPEPAADGSASMDLHGKTVEEALEALDGALNSAMLGSLAELRVIHGRSGGRLKKAVHERLRALPSVRAFRLDPRNPGVTIVTL